VLPAAQADNLVLSDGVVSDGARRNRRHDSFRLRVAPGARFIARLGADSPVTVHVLVAGRELGNWAVSSPSFTEQGLDLALDTPNETALIEVISSEGTFNAAHYWLYEARP
jgi:hypothetical protein